jgi:RimJ/RimL family protein N-acetyltransferase
MILLPMETRLRDGTPTLIREVTPEDADLLRLGFDHLSEESRHYRFFGAISDLSDEQVAAFTSPSDREHVALGAARITPDGLDPAGTARYAALPGDSRSAEFSLTIVDDYQGRGLGSLMFGLLIAVAKANEIDSLVGYVLRGNDAMLHFMHAMGARREPGPDRGVFRVTLDLDHDLPDTALGDTARHAEAAAVFAAVDG